MIDALQCYKNLTAPVVIDGDTRNPLQCPEALVANARAMVDSCVGEEQNRQDLQRREWMIRSIALGICPTIDDQLDFLKK